MTQSLAQFMTQLLRLLMATIATTTLIACSGGGAGSQFPTIDVSSAAFVNGGLIPIKYTAHGTNTAPPLSFMNLPSEAAKLAIIMDDETPPCGTRDNACVHWGVFNLPVSKTSIAESEDLSLVAGVVLGRAYNGQEGYQGPNPPSTHTYRLTVYALNSAAPTIATSPTPSFTRSQFETQYSPHIVGRGTLTGIFTP